ncbi:MAG: TIM barrel protein [Candidatus Gastranaerophilales bacterium]|nr:TIM barrel protein [Candidatus Gastranaerophilales bacterium]
MNNLHFLTAGTPLRVEGQGYEKAFQTLEELNLDGMELEFVHGVRMKPESQDFVKNIIKEKNFLLTAHGPYYINLNSKEPEKVEASIVRVLDTARMAQKLGLYSITFHAAFYMGGDKNVVQRQVEKTMTQICETLDKEKIDVWIRPETTGKPTQWGDLDEIIAISKNFDNVLPCVDFAHLHARYNGISNTYDEFSRILEKIGNELGQTAIDNFHAHLAGIAYGEKGEKKHLILEESDMNYKDLLKAFKKFDVKGALVCESPNIEDDTILLKHFYNSL